jgi:monofunctional biosynthetic peptidoglycan transglycosylase
VRSHANIDRKFCAERSMTPRSESVPIILALAPTVLWVGSVHGQEVSRTVLEFVPNAVEAWYVVNDGVMGGVSSSQMRHLAENVAVFEGNLSLENNGGFASVRTEIKERALEGASALVLRVRGDGKRYQLRLRMDRSWDRVAYGASFETTAGEWMTVEVPLERFRPTFRGSLPRNARPLDPARVRQIGLMLTDKQEGPFRLEIAGLDVVVGSS